MDNNFEYSCELLDDFLQNIYFEEIKNNHGGMKINDMFSLYFLLKKLNPTIIIESGIWRGYSTKLIRKTLGEHAKIICLDPLDIYNEGFKDKNSNTIYFTGDYFIDFEKLNLTDINITNDSNKILCVFDDHQNSAQRLLQCINKGIKHVFFNDNYPLNAGSHYSIQHMIDNDLRQNFDIENQYHYSINTFPQIDLTRRKYLINKINDYVVFPNIFPATIELVEGIFCVKGFFENNDDYNINKYKIFYENKKDYSWNTYLTLL